MSIEFWIKLFVVAVTFVGHVGLWVWCYNRINATAFARKTIKRIEKLVVLACGVIPFLLAALEWKWLSDRSLLLPGSIVTIFYGALVAVFSAIFGPFWLAHRPQFSIAKSRYRISSSRVMRDLHRNLPEWIVSPSWRQALRLPRNEVLSIDCNEKELQIDFLPSELDGFRIGHVSDVHLTGKLTSGFYRRAIDWLVGQRLDLLIVSGDIVDYRTATRLLEPVFGGLAPELNKLFVLGNHDRVHHSPEEIAVPLERLGWIDLGRSNALIEKNGIGIELLGNELPWLSRQCGQPQSEVRTPTIRIGVAHSPDQLDWGCKQGCNLLLCGHTHGGQIRFPWIGPVISPSWHGSRFASGVFYRKPTMMHVSRGLSGVHPFRWGCTPEITVLVLRRSL